jgi:25S rRNA (uracil2634-N3)-methyltransferase
MTLSDCSTRDEILLVGEGNLSFALAVKKHHVPLCSMTATCFDSLEAAREKYDDLDAHRQEVSLLFDRRWSLKKCQLEDLEATVLFDVDAGALEKCKALRNKRFSHIVFIYPHVGLGEKDQDRNVALNQTLILRFLKSAAAFLKEPSTSTVLADEDPPSDVDDVAVRTVKTGAGSIIIALKEGKPYSLWNVPCVHVVLQTRPTGRSDHSQRRVRFLRPLFCRRQKTSRSTR